MEDKGLNGESFFEVLHMEYIYNYTWWRLIPYNQLSLGELVLFKNDIGIP